MLAGRVAPLRLIAVARSMLDTETAELLAQRVLGDLGEAYWRYLPGASRDSLAPALEGSLWEGVRRSPSRSLKSAYFGAYRSVARTPPAAARLERLWRGAETMAGLPLAERDFIALAQELAVREVPGWAEILERQRDRIENPDRRARFIFVMPALSADTAVRDAFFESLRDPKNREHEPWVLEALGWLHHPLRAGRAERYIRPSLGLLEEVQRTGDIFFPLGWLNGTLDGHNTPAAAAIVQDFLTATPGLPPRLRGKLLQAADGLIRSSRVVFTEPAGGSRN
jgi:aminopeptidase N